LTSSRKEYTILRKHELLRLSWAFFERFWQSISFFVCILSHLFYNSLVDLKSTHEIIEQNENVKLSKIVWFVIKSFAINCELEFLIEKWSISKRIFFLNFFILSFEFIYCHTLIFKVKSLNFSIQRWKLFEMKINIMILKKILSSFIIEEKNSIFKI
jgi:hypothetical protein